MSRPKHRVAERDMMAEKLRVDREPCPRCGVRADLHDEFGCSRRPPA